MKTTLKYAATATLAVAGICAQAAEIHDVEFSGYARGGAYASPAGTPRGGYTLGGDTQKFRLGNEGDNGIELGIGKTFDAGDGMKWSALYMPSVWNGQSGTAQAYVAASGFDFAPEAELWVGQHRLRLQEVHIVDSFLIDYGDNIGAGMTNYGLGFARLGVGISTARTFDYSSSAPNNARRINFDLSDIRVNTGGTLQVLATLVHGNFQMGTSGAGLSIAHMQSDFLIHGLANTFFLQSATGHAGITGKFQGLGDVATGGAEQPGQQSLRIADAINWQSGPFGGQALVAYQTAKFDGGAGNGLGTRDFTLGGRISCAIGRNFKWLTEAATTSRSIDGQDRQYLNKFTIAPTLALAPEFWSRPELRFYLTHANWNGAAAAANSGTGSFGTRGRTSSTLAGVQLEAWW